MTTFMLPTFLSFFFHSKMKYITINFHFVCDHVVNRNLIIPYISTKDQLANALTKPLSRQLFFWIRSKIGVSNGSTILQRSNSVESRSCNLAASHPDIQASQTQPKSLNGWNFCCNQWLITWVNYKSFGHNLWYHFCNFLCIIFTLYLYSVLTVNEHNLSRQYYICLLAPNIVCFIWKC